ncbi:hypothetical protein ACP275_01G036900 [Erythranthe tilingii]
MVLNNNSSPSRLSLPLSHTVDCLDVFSISAPFLFCQLVRTKVLTRYARFDLQPKLRYLVYIMILTNYNCLVWKKLIHSEREFPKDGGNKKKKKKRTQGYM